MWYIGQVPIIVTGKEDEVKQIVPRLQPLQGGTVHQFFGYEDSIVSLTAKVVGTTDAENLKSLTTSGVPFALKDYNNNTLGNFIVSRVKLTQDETKWQSLRPELGCEAPVFTANIELYLETP